MPGGAIHTGVLSIAPQQGKKQQGQSHWGNNTGGLLVRSSLRVRESAEIHKSLCCSQGHLVPTRREDCSEEGSRGWELGGW